MAIYIGTREEIAARLGKQFNKNFSARTTEEIQAELLDLQPYVEKIYRLKEELNQAKAVDSEFNRQHPIFTGKMKLNPGGGKCTNQTRSIQGAAT